jgi:hypothetical protein
MPKLNTSIPTATDMTTRRQLLFVAIGNPIPDTHNPRKHGRAQIPITPGLSPLTMWIVQAMSNKPGPP